MLANHEQRSQILEALKRSNGKYAKPFEQGKMANLSFMGGNWEQYAEIVVSMVIADTLLSIESQLSGLVGRLDAANSPLDGAGSPPSP